MHIYIYIACRKITIKVIVKIVKIASYHSKIRKRRLELAKITKIISAASSLQSTCLFYFEYMFRIINFPLKMQSLQFCERSIGPTKINRWDFINLIIANIFKYMHVPSLAK